LTRSRYISVSYWFSCHLEAISPVEERPDGPDRRQNDESRGHGLCDALNLKLGGECLGSNDLSTIGSNDMLKGRDHKCEWQTVQIR
jgi:hypothetical protein